MNWLKNFWDKSFTEPRYRLLLHIGFWFFLLFFWTRESIFLKIKWYQHYSVTFVGIVFALFLYYPLVYGIVPLIRKKKWILAITLFLLYYAIAILLRTYNIQLIINWYNLKQTWVVGNDFWNRLYKNNFNLIGLATIFFSSLASLVEIIYIPLTIKFIRYAYQSNLKQIWLAKENAQLQLTTLKAQVNPHFFFNTLNNLQSLIVQHEQQKSVELLNQLADFMRSSLYDCNEEYILMEQEMALLANYIAIERVRFEEYANISINLSDNDPYYPVPPFIFLPFIENVFKHGGALPPDDIAINIELDNNPHRMVLTASNRYNEAEAESKGGIGIQNVRKRLAYYFEGNYFLEIEKVSQFYHIKLVINKT